MSKKSTYSGKILKKHGQYPIFVQGNEFIITVATVPAKGPNAPKLDPENPRLLVADLGPRPSQIKIKSHFNAFPQAKTLERAIDSHGGQCEPLMVWRNKIVEGNRRQSILSGRQDEILVIILPDEMTKEQVLTLVTTKHTSGPLEWASYVQSKIAYEFRIKYNWSWEQIRDHCQFNSIKAAKKYVGAYVWYEESGLKDPREWSKFHHAYIPILVEHWGYDAEKAKFVQQKAKKSPYRGADEVAGCSTDFKWFAGLIKSGRLRDCRRSDGLIGPLVRYYDAPHAERTFDILHEKPKNGETAWPAEQYFKSVQQDGWLGRKLDNTEKDFRDILKSRKLIQQFSADNLDNEQIGAKVKSLMLTLERFMRACHGESVIKGRKQRMPAVPVITVDG